jgi:hypothetical protein
MVVYILNQSPKRAIDGKTPYEAWHGTTLVVHYIRTFGCVTHIKVTCPGLKKLDGHSLKTIFVSYKLGSKAYRCYDPATECVIISYDVIFDKATTWCWDDTDSLPQSDSEPFTVEFNTEMVQDFIPGMPLPIPSHAPPSAGEPMAPVAEINEEDLDAEHDDTPLRLRSINDVIDNAAPPGLTHIVFVDVEPNFIFVDEPTSFHEAEQEESCCQAMLEEMKAIEGNKTWELITLPAGHRPIDLKWVYKVECNEAGEVVRHKAHLVVKGYVWRAWWRRDMSCAPASTSMTCSPMWLALSL